VPTSTALESHRQGQHTAIAAGTSGRSSKLIHGGLRYLEQFDLRLVRECPRERELLLQLAPRLIGLVPFFIPVYRHTRRKSWKVRAGLSLYALLGGLNSHARFNAVARSDCNTLQGLHLTDLRAIFRYWDAQTDDTALTRAVMASAENLGAELRLPARFEHAQLHNRSCQISTRPQYEYAVVNRRNKMLPPTGAEDLVSKYQTRVNPICSPKYWNFQKP
jgi:D-erythritol 1-phosphate dehydrogenase